LKWKNALTELIHKRDNQIDIQYKAIEDHNQLTQQKIIAAYEETRKQVSNGQENIQLIAKEALLIQEDQDKISKKL